MELAPGHDFATSPGGSGKARGIVGALKADLYASTLALTPEV
jgi:hypothetical protein